MKKLVVYLVLIFICISVIACSPADQKTTALSTPSPLSTTDLEGYPYIADYERFLAQTDLPDDFVYFEDLPAFGDVANYMGLTILSRDGTYDEYMYGIDDGFFYLGVLWINHNPVSYSERYMGQVVFKDCVPENLLKLTPEDARGYTVLQFGGAQYYYFRRSGELKEISVEVDGIQYTIDAQFWKYPTDQTETLIGRLITKELAEDAIQEFKTALASR